MHERHWLKNAILSRTSSTSRSGSARQWCVTRRQLAIGGFAKCNQNAQGEAPLENAKHRNHELSAMPCPHALGDVDLFAPGAQEHWYEAYALLHAEAPVLRLQGEGLRGGSDAFILTKYADIKQVVRDWERFPPTLSLLVAQIEASGEMPAHLPDIDAMVGSIVSLRPTPALWRAHRKELTDP
jgi:hypothetical protein